MSKEAHAKVKKELKKLKMMHPTSAEATVVRNYIDWILALPWYDKTRGASSTSTRPRRSSTRITTACKKVKERILEYLAVQALMKKLKGPVLCFVGPPGVGKTSLAKSIARATGRKFVRLSLGGVRDEAEIRGHRRTYIGALPGKIIQSLKKAGTNNPVFLLDEVDKMSTDFRGDPAAALLEVLDPEQNHDVQRSLPRPRLRPLRRDVHHDGEHAARGIPVPLQDRMEIIQLTGYTEFEKLNIAEKYLVPRQKKECGARRRRHRRSPRTAIRTIIHHYTKEAGVRSLEREIASVLPQGRAKDVVAQGKEQPSSRSRRPDVPKFLGVPKFRSGKTEEKDEIGLSNGLAVTMHGGDILPSRGHGRAGQGQARRSPACSRRACRSRRRRR